MRPSRAELAVLGLLLVPAHSARGQAIGQGFDLERAGQYQRAAIVYFTTLRAEPTNLAALLGLERVLPSLSRLPELLPAAQRAVAASPRNAALRALLLRTYVALNEPDSARALAQRWTGEQPRDEAPYREWAIALEDAHRFEEARQVFLFGRRALGRPGVFGIELGELLERAGGWERAAREWAAALCATPAQRPTAARSPPPSRSRPPTRRPHCAASPTWRMAGTLPTPAASGHWHSRATPIWSPSRWRCAPGRRPRGRFSEPATGWRRDASSRTWRPTPRRRPMLRRSPRVRWSKP